MLTESKVLVTIILLLGTFSQPNMVVHSNNDCPSTQSFQLGSRGFIICTFPTNLSEVYWYDDVSGRSDVVAIAGFRLRSNEKYGSGIDSGEYDILSNGTLVLTNVTVRYEKQYKTLACTQISCSPLSTVSVEVTAYPRASSPSITSCNDGSPCVFAFTKTRRLTCQFDSTRPPVHLEWMGQVNGEDTKIERQTSFSELNSDNVTYKSYAVLNETVTNDRLLAVYSCKPTWITAGLVTERKILIDFSEKRDLLNLPSEDTIYYEINRRSELRCNEQNFSEIIWRKISSSGSIDTIGFKFEGVIQTNEEFLNDVILSTDGSLIFTSLQLHHEGTYACIYDNGKDVKGMQRRYLQVLVPPSPPYIQIKECKENDPCIFSGNRNGSLTCFIHGVQPEVSLKWIATNDKLVRLHDSKAVIKERGQLTDVSITVNYNLEPVVACGTSVELKCQVGHPISRIIQPYAKTVISTDECTDHDDSGDQRNALVAIMIAVAAVCSLGTVCFIIYCWKRKHSKSNHSVQENESIDTEADAIFMSQQPNGHALLTPAYVVKNGHGGDKQRGLGRQNTI